MTNHAYQLVGLAKRSQNLLGKVKLDEYKALIEHKKDITKVVKIQFFVFLETFLKYEVRLLFVSDSEFRAASEST